MPLLVFLSSAFSSIQIFIALYYVKKVVVFGVAIGLLALATSGFIDGITTIINNLSYSVPPSIVTGCRIFLPSNFITCLSAVLSAYSLRYTYDWTCQIIKMKLN